MEKLFDELDHDASGAISLDELEAHMQDPKLTAYFSALHLDVTQVKKLFHLIDLDKSGSIEREEFIFGCMSLKGTAKNLDVAILQYETLVVRNLVIRLGAHLDGWFESLVPLARSSALTEHTVSKWPTHASD